MYNTKSHEFLSCCSQILEIGQNDLREEANSLHIHTHTHTHTHTPCTVRAYNPRFATTVLTSIHTNTHTHTHIHVHYHQHPTTPLVLVFSLRLANQPIIAFKAFAKYRRRPCSTEHRQTTQQHGVLCCDAVGGASKRRDHSPHDEPL